MNYRFTCLRPADRQVKLAQYARGWMDYFGIPACAAKRGGAAGISDFCRPIPELDHWLCRRVRMCYWKQWCHVRTKVRHLLAPGTSKREASLTAFSRKSYWHLSRT